jgi:glycosyltransferase involved in cell wall biosynthesis
VKGAEELKILHILSTPRAEGTPNLVLDWLATGLHEQEVFVLNSQPADLTDRLRTAAGWYGEEDYFGRGKRKFTDIAAGIRRVCRERQPDLVLCWPTGFANWVCSGARLAGVRKLLVHCGNPPNRGFKGDWMSRYGLWPLALLGAKCICCSDYVRNQYQAIPGISPDLLHAVWNCARSAEVGHRAAEARRERREGGEFIAIMVATLERHKDHATLLHAVASIRRKFPEFRLRLAGAGSLRQEMQQLADKLEVSDIVEFLGMRRDVPELLGQADLFVFATTPQEGLGSVLLEAMAAELPILASDVPACRELLCGGKYGRLVAAAEPAALAAALLEAINAEPDTAGLHAARAFADGFTAERMIRDYLEIAMPPNPQ